MNSEVKMVSSMLNFSLFSFTKSCLPLIVGEREKRYLLNYICYSISHDMCFSKSLFLSKPSFSGKRYWISHVHFTQRFFLTSNNFSGTVIMLPALYRCKFLLWVQVLPPFSYASKHIDFHWLSTSCPSCGKHWKHFQDSLRDYTVARSWQHGLWAPGFNLWELVESTSFRSFGCC